MLDDLSLRELFLVVGLELNGEVLEDGLNAGLVHTDLSLPQNGGRRTSPREEDELSPGGVIIGGEVNSNKAVVDLVIREVGDSFIYTSRTLTNNMDGGVILVAKQNPFEKKIKLTQMPAVT